MARIRKDVENDIKREQDELSRARERYNDALRSNRAHINSIGRDEWGYLTQTLVKGQLERSAERYYDQFVKPIEDRISHLRSELDALCPIYQEKLKQQTHFDVILQSTGSAKLALIKAIQELAGLGLKEAKDIVDAAPTVLTKGVTRNEAEVLKRELEEIGAEITIR